MSKNILFIAPLFMNIFEDVKTELVAQGYNVDFIPEGHYLEDPDNVRGYKGIKKILYVNPKKFQRRNSSKWKVLLSETPFNKVYDVLFVIDGQSIPKNVFEILRFRNPKLLAINYLFDTVKGVYRFDKNFSEYNKVYTFDKGESQLYGIRHLPIYWVKTSDKPTVAYDIFAFGRYSDIRLKLFKQIQKISKENNFKSFIKLATDKEKNMSIVRVKWMIRKFLGKTKGHIAPSFYDDEMNTYEPISPQDFRSLILKSNVIVDTSAPHQDGLTARFMWALGYGKKIITTNQSIKQYGFYNKNQVYVVDDVDLIDDNEISKFLRNELICLEEKQKCLISRLELSNWINLLING